MLILVVSDTHRKNENYLKLMETVKPDLILHCGDAEGTEEELIYSAECPVEIVAGNNDYFTDLPHELVISTEGYKIWLLHGHNYYVSMGNERIKEEAMARGMDMVIYGHTHKPVVDMEDDVIAMNPGSLSYPRQEGKKPSYILMEIDDNGEIDARIHYLE